MSTPTMTEPTCDEFKELSAELALGILHGRERADVIAHLETCPACHEELLLMGDLADRIVALTPSAEPPAGFETRVLAGLAPRAKRPRRRPVGLILAAAVVAVAIGVGGWAIGRAGHHRGGSEVVAAAFVSHGQTVGQLVESNDAYPWVYMTVDTNLGAKTIICELTATGGKTVRLGQFRLTAGSGQWGAALPAAIGHVTGARLVDAHGVTVATATFA
jgi:hypothetical protein